MASIYILYFFLLGLAVGSFLNVVISRFNQEKSFWKGRSACPICHDKIYWFDNIPVLSFLLLRGRCRKCQKNISWQYPLVELGTAFVFSLLYFQFGLSEQLFAYIIFSCFLIVIFVYDLLHYQILDRVSVPAIVVSFGLSLYLGLGIKNLFLGALIGGLFFAIQYVASAINFSFLNNKKKMFDLDGLGRWVGDGDIRLGVIMGVMLGWKLLLVALFLSYVIGSIFGIGLIALNKKKLSSAVPFGPFLTLGTFIALLYGQRLLDWYINLVF